MSQQSLSQRYPAYYKNVENVDSIDVYAVHQLFQVNDPSGALQHASKKLLLAGARTGGKPAIKDVQEARDTLTRYLEIHNVGVLLAPSVKPAPEAANDPLMDLLKLATLFAEGLELVPMEEPTPEAKAVELTRYVLLYYFQHDDRRFKPRQYFAMAKSQSEAVGNFKTDYGNADIVWIEQVKYFMPDADAVSRKYWVQR